MSAAHSGRFPLPRFRPAQYGAHRSRCGDPVASVPAGHEERRFIAGDNRSGILGTFPFGLSKAILGQGIFVGLNAKSVRELSHVWVVGMETKGPKLTEVNIET